MRHCVDQQAKTSRDAELEPLASLVCRALSFFFRDKRFRSDPRRGEMYATLRCMLNLEGYESVANSVLQN